MGISAGGETTQIDLVLAAGTDRLLVPLKTFITNYRRPGKNVTQSRDAILADLRVVGARQDDHTTGAVLWLAYPIPTEREADRRVTHVRPIEKQAETKLLAKVNVGQAYVHVYLSQPTRSTASPS